LEYFPSTSGLPSGEESRLLRVEVMRVQDLVEYSAAL